MNVQTLRKTFKSLKKKVEIWQVLKNVFYKFDKL